jgi:hypothetical protein
VTSQPPTPTGTAGADLLLLELAETTQNDRGATGFGRQPDGRVLDHLNRPMVEFAGRMATAFVATADDSGECDCTLRSGPPGFVHVLNDRTIAYPEDRPAREDAGEQARIGLLMMDLVTVDTMTIGTGLAGLHVTGTASVVADSVLRGEHPDLPAAVADRWVLVHVVEAFTVRPQITATA